MVHRAELDAAMRARDAATGGPAALHRAAPPARELGVRRLIGGALIRLGSWISPAPTRSRSVMPH